MPIAAKLGIRPGIRVWLVAKPAALDLSLPNGAIVHTRRGREHYDVVAAFVASQRSLDVRFPPLVEALQPAGALWLCWPKRASEVVTDLTEGGIRAFGLDAGLVDVKITSIDATWSSLKFVRRLADR
jgi:hypothetical protein